jgi:hypothetical protein
VNAGLDIVGTRCARHHVQSGLCHIGMWVTRCLEAALELALLG